MIHCMVLPYPKGLIVIKNIFHIVLVYLLWCFCIQYLVLNKSKVAREVVGGPRGPIVIIVEVI
jgi:hypothetical protein